MTLRPFVLALMTVGFAAACTPATPATPNVEVRLPQTEVGRWSLERTIRPEHGSEKFIFLDTAKGTVCVLAANDIPSSLSVSLRNIPIDKCAKLPG